MVSVWGGIWDRKTGFGEEIYDGVEIEAEARDEDDGVYHYRACFSFFFVFEGSFFKGAMYKKTRATVV